LRVEGEGNSWTRLVAETRVQGTDVAAQRTPGRYWCLIYPGSGMIRRMWLNAARVRAESRHD
jgi:hypothetical protein